MPSAKTRRIKERCLLITRLPRHGVNKELFCSYFANSSQQLIETKNFFQSKKIIFFQKLSKSVWKKICWAEFSVTKLNFFYSVQKWIRKNFCCAWDCHCSGKITTDKKLMRLAHCFYEKNEYLIARLYSMNISKFGKLSEIPGRKIFPM